MSMGEKIDYVCKCLYQMSQLESNKEKADAHLDAIILLRAIYREEGGEK